jgi:phospholipid-binding lipoprotein MlaA
VRLGTFGLLCAAMIATACATPEGAVGEPSGVRGVAARAGASVSSGVNGAWSKLKTPEDSVVADPFEPFNRAMYAFNDGLDRVLLGPAANVYSTVVPATGRARVRDFIDNWKSPVWFANDVLQGDFNHAGVTAQRFALNTTVGVLGVYDYAAHHADLPKRDEDFGQTLGVHGVANGPYLMLPILGPTTFRDLTGSIMDIAMDPITYAEFDGDDAYRITTRTVDIVDIRVQTDPAIETIRESVDPYAQARALYIQNRNDRIRNGDDDYEELPDF